MKDLSHATARPSRRKFSAPTSARRGRASDSSAPFCEILALKRRAPRFGSCSGDWVAACGSSRSGGGKRCVVADGTKIRALNGRIFVFRRDGSEGPRSGDLHISKHRETINVLGFPGRTLRYCEGNPVLVTNGGPWYRWPTATNISLKNTR